MSLNMGHSFGGSIYYMKLIFCIIVPRNEI